MKNKGNITRPPVSSMQIYCILISALLSVVRVCASTTADSVYFHIKADTMREIRAGQVVELTYALVNAQFDSVSPPVFNSSIEVIEGPKSHEGSSYAIINGVGRKSHESGFSYIVQFRQSGEVELPSASVKAGNRTYTTPECRVTVHPAVVDMNKLKCSLKVGRMAGGYAKYCATLTCNACPDQNPLLLSINGKIFRPTRKSFSISNGKEEYVYEYFFNDDSYEVSCEELTFGGKPYSVKPKKGKLAGADFLIAIAVAGALFELAWWLACKRRYREDKDALLAEFVLEKKALPLTVSWAYTHYGVSHTLLLFSVLFLATTGVAIYTDSLFMSVFFWLGIAFVPLAYLSYRHQRRKLDFQSIPTTLDEQAIYDRIYNLAATYDWDVDHYGEDCIVAHTNPAIWHLTWGEQIFIVFDKGQVWVNSVNDLNKRTSPFSFGYAKRNVRRIRDALTQSAAIRD